MAEYTARIALEDERAAEPDGQRSIPRDVWPVIPLLVFLAIIAFGWWPGLDPTEQNLTNRLQPPVGWGGTWEHPAGTDSLGRDLLSRVVIGARLSLIIGLVAALLAAGIGVVLGLWGGIAGGLADDLVTALSEMVLAIPTIVVGLVVVATLGQGLTNLLGLLVLTAWIAQARVLRLQARRVMHSDFVTASLALGAGVRHVATRHVVPNVSSLIVVVLCQQVAAIMIWESSLTYLGIGLPIEQVSLGGLIRDGQQHLFDAPWLGIIPGIVLAWGIVSFNVLSGCIQAWLERGRARTSVP
ncbi:MAG TPA: ABC transporter permease [Thermomicrobiales bacterium]|nr:ABC transporter permease [Thermomicrobiales bacterium]